MLLPYTTLEYYGPGAAAMVADAGLGELGLAVPHQAMRPALNAPGAGDAPVLRPYRGRAFGITVDAQGLLHAATPHKRARFGLRVLVSALSQDDVTGAVLEAPVEGTLTLRQALRLLLAHAAGDATGLDGNPAFKSLDGSKTRVAGTISGGARTITARDGT